MQSNRQHTRSPAYLRLLGRVVATAGLLALAFLAAQVLHSLEHSATWAALHRTWHLDELFTVATVLAVLFGVSTFRQRRARLRTQDRLEEVEIDYRQVAQDLALIHAADRAIEDGMSLHDILVMLSGQTAEMFPGSRAAVYLVSEDQQYLDPVRETLNPTTMERVERLLGRGIAHPRIKLRGGGWYQRTLQEGKPVITSDPADIQQMMREFEGSEAFATFIPAIGALLGIRSVMAVPINRDGRPVALLDISGRLEFDTRDLERLAAVGKELEFALKRKLQGEQLERQSRLEALGDMAGMAGHYLNSQLTAIVGHTRHLLATPGLEAAGEDLQAVQSAAESAGQVTHRLLAFSGGIAVEARTFELNAFLKTVATRLQRVLGARVQLDLSLSPDAGAVSTDPRRVEEMLTHLAVSARDALPEGGRLILQTVDAHPAEAEDAAPGPHGAGGSYALLTVSDSRPGVEEDALAQIFQPKLESAVSAEVSFALPAAYGIVTRLGGTIQAVRPRMGGISFRIHLPRNSDACPLPVEALLRPQAPARRPSSARRTVLLAEDEAALRRMVVRVLPQFEVLEVADAFQALELSDSFAGSIEVLITDIMMPGMDGRALARALIERRPGLPVLFISGYATGLDAREADVGTRTAYLEKPFTPDQLREAIERLLSGA
ncbi:MAG: response regulator [Actinobacteria bacterium]|nr:response regulator [Actinomycetota bacterium]